MKIPKQWLLSILLVLMVTLTDHTAASAAQKLNDGSASEETAASMRKQKSFDPEIKLEPYEKNIFQSEAHTLTLSDVPSGCSVEFSSSDSDVISVEKISNNSCRYTGIGYGSAKINISIVKSSFLFFEQKKTRDIKINVSPKAVSIKFAKSVRKFAAGDSAKLAVTIRPSISNERPVFESSNRKVARINKRGKVTALKSGKAFITATLQNGKSAKCKVVVY
ncbi:MAG: Ig-like domain-containing protein [Clostridiaceae bacterium]|nr:Ig-like domain-containing protein [Clostridiaceae bacterium]